MEHSELIGAELDEAVAKLEHIHHEMARDRSRCVRIYQGAMGTDFEFYSPSTDWSQGGPLIERERLSVCASFSHPAEGPVVFRCWLAETPGGLEAEGPTPLIAAMRAFEASK